MQEEVGSSSSSTAYCRQANSNASGLEPLKKRRVRTGCLTCRQRKVKCDEIHPRCGACRRLEATCVWAEAAQTENASRQTRKRARRVCEQCRALKAGCSREKPSCALCRAKGVICTYAQYSNSDLESPGDIRPVPLVRSATDRSQPESSGSPVPVPRRTSTRIPEYTTQQLLDLYFTQFHTASWNGFLHQQTFMATYEAKRVPRYLLLSMCAAANYLAAPGSPRTEDWLQETKQYLHSALEQPTTDIIAAILNILFVESGMRRRPNSMWMLTGLAVRTAYALRLNFEDGPSQLSLFEKETRRRLMWACFGMDQMIAGGVYEFCQTPLNAMHLKLPTDATRFRTTGENVSSIIRLPLASKEDDHQKGILAQYVTAMAIRQRICSYVFNLSTEESPPWEEGSLFGSCEQDLQTITAGLGPQCSLSDENIAEADKAGELCRLFELHIWLSQCASDLNRIAIYGFAESARPEILLSAPFDWIRNTQEHCFQAAVRVSSVALTFLTKSPDFAPLDPVVLVSFYESIRIQVWAFKHIVPKEEHDLKQKEALPRVKACLTILLRASRTFATAARLFRMASFLLKDSSLWTLLSNEAIPVFYNPVTSARLLENPHRPLGFAGYPNSPSCLTEVLDEVVAGHDLRPLEEMWQSAAHGGGQPEGVANKPSAPLPDVYAHGILGIGGNFKKQGAAPSEHVESAISRQAVQKPEQPPSVFWSDLLKLGTEPPSRNTAFSVENTGADAGHGIADPANESSLDFLNTLQQSSYHPNEATPSYLSEDFWSSGASMSFGSMLSGQNTDWSWLQTDQAFST